MWRKAKISDVETLLSMFWGNLSEAPQYISHGEIQMGVALAPGVLAPDGKIKWTNYIKEKIQNQNLIFDANNPDSFPSAVFVYQEQEKIVAFEVLEITADFDKPFGVICDMLVSSSYRGKGLGGKLFEKAKEWFNSMGINDIYLESGLNNHSAHAFFEKKGFKPISYIFKLS